MGTALQPPRPLGRKRLLPGSGWRGSASCGRLGTLQTVSADPSGPAPWTSRKRWRPFALTVSRSSFSGFPVASAGAKPLPFLSQAATPPGSQRMDLSPLRGRYWIPRPSLVAPGELRRLGTVGGREEDVVSFQSTPTSSLSQPGARARCGIRWSTLRQRGTPASPSLGFPESPAEPPWPSVALHAFLSHFAVARSEAGGGRWVGAPRQAWRQGARTQGLDAWRCRGVRGRRLSLIFRTSARGPHAPPGPALRQRRLLVP